MSSALIVLGTRPEAIKLAPVIHECRRRRLPVEVVSTGQHRESLDPILRDLEVTPDHHLSILTPGQGLARLSARALEALEDVYVQRRPAYVLVQGDTTTVAMAALCAHYQRIPIGHLEAGLRSGNRDRPFPEESNRRLVTLLAHDHFAPTAQAEANLRAEGVDPATVFRVGNTVIDALFQMRDRVAGQPLGALDPHLADLPEARLVLVTAHRRESHGAAMARVADGLARVAGDHPEWHLVLPLHPNPAASEPLRARLQGLPNVRLTPPLGYPALVALLHRAQLVLTDSGGIQEEAAALGRAVLVLRRETDRPEAVAAGVARLVGDDPDRLVEEAGALLDDDNLRSRMARPVDVFGDGRAAGRVADVLARRLTGREETSP